MLLEIVVEGFAESPNRVWVLQGMCGPLARDLQPGYVTVLHGTAGKLVGRGKLSPYPPWSEPLGLMVARGIDAALGLNGGADVLVDNAYRFMISVRETRRLLLRTTAVLREGGLVLSDGQRCGLPNPTRGAWSLAQAVLTMECSGSPHLPASPSPVNLPVYRLAGLAYCRIRDMPEDAAQAYRRSEWSGAKPLGPDVPGDAIAPADAEGFFGLEGWAEE